MRECSHRAYYGPSWTPDPLGALTYSVWPALAGDRDPRDVAVERHPDGSFTSRILSSIIQPAAILAVIDVGRGRAPEVIVDPRRLGAVSMVDSDELHELVPRRPVYVSTHSDRTRDGQQRAVHGGWIAA